MKKINPRYIAAKIIRDILLHQGSLATISLEKNELPERAFIQALCYGVMRRYFFLKFLIDQLLEKPLKQKDTDIEALILVGLYQLIGMRVPVHAAIFETVEASKNFKKLWAKNLVNAVLQRFLREQDKLFKLAEQNVEAHTQHPKWLIQKIQKDWPEHFQTILHASNVLPPMSLRVNCQQTTRDAYLKKLFLNGFSAHKHSEVDTCLILDSPVSVDQLPGFWQGEVSVQDASAQLAATLLDVQSNQRILDACAAPGGKTTHILELISMTRSSSSKSLSLLSQRQNNEDKNLTAIDIEAKRLRKIQENLDRLGLSATLICDDASNVEHWWNGKKFDRILLDAPCSVSGVIRRHPDIKYLRQKSDIKLLVNTQKKLLEALWPLLNVNGKLLYVTCSILHEENSDVIANFLVNHSDSKEELIKAHWGIKQLHGRQILPGKNNMDGFYYALLQKV